MAPRPARNFQQSQPITTGLRIVCESYPAATCLRELLQNADDAGASEIECVLDTKFYTNEPLLDDALQEYHGPALLVKNNSVFTDQDFSSLSSVGDSRKRNDATTTGKFGLGFNSVYHWTDGPWILSRRWLLLLDPHKRWSSATDMPGGPTWDFVEDHDTVELQNHLETFQLFDLDTSKEIDLTIIRIPLRTVAQAATSEIVKQEVRLDDIKKALEQFGQEMKEGGLLFLKYIRKITLRIDNDLVASIQVLENNSTDLKIRDELPSDFKRLYVQTPSRTEHDLHKFFELDIEYATGASSSINRYLISHTMMRSSGDQKMDLWARQKKLFPWTAVAAPLTGNSPKGSFRGQLFCTLRLPIYTNHPVHIHGLWSIAPDRARLSSSGQSPGYEDLETKWNQFMFQRCASVSWTNLLLHRRQDSWKEESFGFWPQTISTPSDIWSHLINWILDKIIAEKISVWNTANGCVATGQGFFSEANGEAAKYAPALVQIQIPAVFLDEKLLEKTSERAKLFSQQLSMVKPYSVRGFLRDHPTLVSSDTTPLLLEYCLLDAFDKNTSQITRNRIYHGLQGIALWPIVGDVLSNLKELILPRDLEEMNLFSGARESQTLDINRLTPSVIDLLLRDIDGISSLRFRSMSDLQQDWPLIYRVTHGFSKSDTLVQRPLSFDRKIWAIWTWICARKNFEMNDFSLLDDLWLLPVNGSLIRRFASGPESFPTLIVEKNESLYQLMTEIVSGGHTAAATILETELLPPEAVKVLRKQVKIRPQIGVACLDHLESLVAWLAACKDGIIQVSVQQKLLLLETLASLVKNRPFSIKPSSTLTNQIKCLPLYSKSSSAAPFKDRMVTKCDLNRPDHAVEIPNFFPPMPDVRGISFYDTSNASEKHLVEYFGLLEKMPLKTLLETYLLPWAVNESATEAKENLIDFIFNDHRSKYPLDPSWATMIASHPITPLALNYAQSPKRYGCLKDLVHPDSNLSKLYFKREDFFPEAMFFEKHKNALSALGIRSLLTGADMVDRIQYFSRCSADELVEKVESLLSLPIPRDSKLDSVMINTIRTLKWIPGKPAEGGPISLFTPNDCRGADMSALTDLVLGTTNFSVKDDWKKLLGWDKPVAKDVLLRQLKGCVALRLHDKVNKLLDYPGFSDYSDLITTPCILGSHKDYHTPQNTFLSKGLLGDYPMAPAVDEVDSHFQEEHPNLIKALSIRHEPSLNDILEVQKNLKSSTQTLNKSDLKIIISSLEIAVRLFKESELTDMLVPDSQNVLRSLSDIVYGDRNVSGVVADFNFTHPEISTKIIEGLGVERSLGRAARLDIEFEDEDEDEYTPREKLTTVISDTLGRYSIESTFSEYLANAEDCGATNICWILDECKNGYHDSSHLLTPELKPLQGPALMVHNDGVFSDKDFNGFKDIGQGGKSDDATSTGMFGRGALSMFHFTDVPMIVSGGYILILDPQQELLPRNKHFKRKAGVKVPLATAHRLFRDQLVPFDGIYGYSKDHDYYEGTIFRFPFRNSITMNTSQKMQQISYRSYGNVGIKRERITTDSVTTRELLENYFKDASIALLFLRNVKKIKFFIRGDPLPKWSVQANRSESASDGIFQEVTISTSKEGILSTSEEETILNSKEAKMIWRTSSIDIEQSPDGIIKPGRGATKITECGVAACISHPEATQRVFCRLPTAFTSYIPISFHASFAITGDRQSIPYELIPRDLEIAKWNHWLLDSCIPGLYLEFLRDLVPRIGKKSYRFWPTTDNQGRTDFMSDLVANSFWTKVMDEEHKHWYLYPLVSPKAIASSTPLVSRPGQNRMLYRATSSTLATFDLLPQKISAKLRNLFNTTCSTLVSPPHELCNEIKKLEARDFKQLNSDYICQLFREEVNCKHLAKFLANLTLETRVEAFEMFFNILVPLPKDNVAALDLINGCKVLPLRDGSFGTLQLNPTAKSEWYFYATEEEQKLFSFASCSFIDTRFFQGNSALLSSKSTSSRDSTISRNPIKTIMETTFNIRTLALQDIGILLTHSQSLVASGLESESRRLWTVDLWLYLNKRLEEKLDEFSSGEDSFLSLCDIRDQPIYQVKFSKQCRHITPSEFETGPYILEPNEKRQGMLCEEIKDLETVDQVCVPSLLSVKESNMNGVPSFIRWLRALTKIEVQTRTPIHKFLVKQLKSTSIETMRELLIKHVTDKTFSALENNPVLQALPVWPSMKSLVPPVSSGYMSMNTARFCPHKSMLMPWFNRLETFVMPEMVKKNSTILSRIGAHLMTISEVWNFVKQDLPKSLHKVDSDQYLAFVGDLAADNVELGSSNVAPNSNGVLCHASSLFDHDEPIFLAAFQASEPTRFLNASFRVSSRKSFWLRNGLRTRSESGYIAAEDFLQCALAIQDRWPAGTWSETFYHDAKTVAEYLCWDKPDFRKWPQTTWDKIFRTPIFRVEDSLGGEFVYRRAQMRQIAQRQSHICLDQVTHARFKSIVWSQVAFLKKPPTDFILENLPDGGYPSVATVFDHLGFLISICMEIIVVELPEYIKDIQASYDYLQNHEEETSLISNIREASVWINLDTTDIKTISAQDIQSSLEPAQSLCMNCPTDPLPLRVARKFLVPYEKLLKALGCPSVIRPSIAASTASTNSAEPPMAVSLIKIRDLRDQGRWVDVVFEAEGQQKNAHKIFMAAVSKYCEAQFSGEWGRLLQQQAKISITDMKFTTLSQMVDFAYTGEIEWAGVKDQTDNDEIAESLDELLDLLQATDRWILDRLHQKTEDYVISHYDLYVRPDNVLDVQDIAKGARAARLVRLCEEFVSANADFVAAFPRT